MNSDFIQDSVQRTCFGSSRMFYPFKGCSTGPHLLEMKLPFSN